MGPLSIKGVGDYIREQRHAAQVSVRQLARLAGVSNPYLSQIERGLRKPSAEILQQIAKALRISAEQLYLQAGILTERVGAPEVVAAILVDPALAERQKQVLLEIYESFCKENASRPAASGDPAANAAITAASVAISSAVDQGAADHDAADQDAAADVAADAELAFEPALDLAAGPAGEGMAADQPDPAESAPAGAAGDGKTDEGAGKPNLRSVS